MLYETVGKWPEGRRQVCRDCGYTVFHSHTVTTETSEKNMNNQDYGDWQVIFKTAENLDYCRETKTVESFTFDQVIDWAVDQIANHSDIAAARLEKF